MKVFLTILCVATSLFVVAEEESETVITNHFGYYGNEYEVGTSYSSLKVVTPVEASGVITNVNAIYRYEYYVDWLTVGNGEPISSYNPPTNEWIFNGVVSNRAVMMICPRYTNENGIAIFSGEINVPDILVGANKQCDLTWCHAAIKSDSYSGYTIEYGKLGEHSFDEVTAINLPEGYLIPKLTSEFLDSLYTVYDDVASLGYGNFESMGFWNLKEMTIRSRPYVFTENDYFHNMRRYLVYADQINVPEEHSDKWLKVLRNLGYGGKVHVIGSCATNGLQTVTLATTNVVLHYVLNNVVVSNVTPQVEQTGFVNVITEIKGGAVAVPSTWADRYPTFSGKFGSDFSLALMKKSGKKDALGNDMFVWQDYVAGTDPTKETDSFKALIVVEGGVPKVSYLPELEEEEKAKRVYTTYGKVRLADEKWSVVKGTLSDFNFFKVTVELRK